MLKFVAAIAASLALLLWAPTPSSAGILPGRQHNDKFILYYLYQKTMDSCYGEGYIKAKEMEVREIFGPCMVKAWQVQPETEKSSEKEKRSLDIASDRSNDNAAESFANEIDNEKVMMETPFFPANIIRPLKDEVFKNYRIASCLFDAYNLTVSANGTVDAHDYIRDAQEDATIPEDVKKYLVEGLHSCEVKSKIGDFMLWGPKYVEFMKILKFFRCAQGEVFAACIKVDLNKTAGDYDLSGLDGALDGADDLAKRYFVKSSYINWDNTGIWDTL